MNKNYISEENIKKEIRNILLNEWDPIGIKHFQEARDEYDIYIPFIYECLIAKKSQDELFKTLWWIETQRMGLVGEQQKTKRIAKRLFQITPFSSS